MSLLTFANLWNSMFFHLLLIHLYRPFLKYTNSNTPLPPRVSPRKVCTQAALAISRLLRMYERTYGFRQICNIAVYITHTACTIHLLNLPDKNAQRDVVHGLKHLEAMGDGWLNARRSLRILDISANKWQIKLPRAASAIFERTHDQWGYWGSWDQATSSSTENSPVMNSNLATYAPNLAAGHLLPPEGGVAPALTANTSISATPPVAGAPMNRFPHPFTSATSASFPSIAPDYQTAEILLPQPDLAPPEPTYLRPISYTGSQFPLLYSTSPPKLSSHSDPWHGVQGTQVPSRYPFFHSTASPIPGYNATANLGAESQQWDSKDAAALGVGIEHWSDAWDPALGSLQRQS